MDRRRFLALTLASLGMTQLDLQRRGLRYARALAQPTRRKCALLVGVNQYPTSDRFFDLYGCATDVEMQRQLLIHRFGFLPEDICVVSDDSDLSPTRDNILTAFEEHLIKPVREGDVAVFHFSGHGSRVIDPNPLHPDDLNSTFVPGDVAGDSGPVDDIMGRTLFLLMSALKTENVTAVLDSCYSGGGTRGHLRIRAADGGRTFSPSDRELAYQEARLARLEGQVSLEELQARRQLGVAKGVVIAAAQRDEPAAEVTFDGFDAGAFTYLLTQFLWQHSDPLSGTVARIRADTRQLSGQLPLVDTQVADGKRPTYFVPAAERPDPAAAVVTAAAGEDSLVWLGGVHPEAVVTLSRGSTLTGLDGQPLTITERRGLVAKVNRPVAASTPLGEAARVIPSDLTLRVGIDPSLAATASAMAERIDGWPHMAGEIANPDGSYNSEIHLILSAMTPAYRRLVGGGAAPPVGQIGLFDPALTRWIPESFYGADLPVASLLGRLYPRLRLQLAARFLAVSVNDEATTLALQAEINDAQGTLLASTAGGSSSGQIRTGEPITITLTNRHDAPLHAGVVGIFPSGYLTVLLPDNLSKPLQLAPGETKQIPDPATLSKLVLEQPGRYTVLAMASRQPFTRTLQGLAALADGTRRHLPEEISDPTATGLDALLAGFDTPRGEADEQSPTVLEASEMVALSLTLEALPSGAPSGTGLDKTG